MTTKYFETKDQYIAFRNAWAKAAQAGKIQASHMMLYNIIRGKDPQHGFTPFQRRSKFEGMGMFNRGAVMAHHELKAMQQQYLGSKYWDKWVDAWLEPFGDTFTKDDLKRIIIPDIEELWTLFGKGLRINKNLPDGFKAKTVDELLALDVEDAA